MRQYQPIWEAIKKRNHASIVAPVTNHKRIIKAVIKEKHKDEGYKLLMAEKALSVKLVVVKDATNPELIHFSLETRLVDKYIGVHNL